MNKLEEIKNFFIKNGYQVRDDRMFSEESLLVKNDIHTEYFEEPEVKQITFCEKTIIIHLEEKTWVTIQPKHGGKNVYTKFKSGQKAIDFMLAFLGPPKYEKNETEQRDGE